MNFSIHRDLRSIAFVRCLTPINGSRYYAEGNGFTVASAIAKCRSEAIEREIHETLSNPESIAGIAAHPIEKHARAAAINEFIESQLVSSININLLFFGLPLFFGKKQIWIGRLPNSFCAVGRIQLQSGIALTQSISKNPLKAILKTWIELRSIAISNPDRNRLEIFTRGNKQMSQEKIKNIKFRMGIKVNPLPATPVTEETHYAHHHYVVCIRKDTA